jgi:hypothetical protein
LREKKNKARIEGKITGAKLSRQLLMVRNYHQCYDPEKHGDMDWICRTLDNLLSLYEIEGTFKRVNNEIWYQNRIWTMVDKLVETVQDVNVVRYAITCNIESYTYWFFFLVVKLAPMLVA